MRQAIKIAAIAFSCVFLGRSVRAECVTVEGPKQQKASGQNVRVVVMLANKAIKGARVDFYQGASQPVYSASTDENGMAVPHELTPGDYNVVATLDTGVSTSLWLDVLAGDGVTILSMDLTKAQEMIDAQQKRLDELPLRDHIRLFDGTVVDPTGAFIAAANVKVVKKGSPRGIVALQIKADASGHFSAPLDEGLYIAFISAQGFRTEGVPFEVTKAGSGNLRVSLTVGHC